MNDWTGRGSQTPQEESDTGIQNISRSVELWSLLGIVLVTAVLRLLILGGDARIIPTDGTSFMEIAKNIANNFSFYHSTFTPGYPMWVALFQKLTGVEWVAAGQWTSFIFSMLLLLPLYSIFRRCVSVPGAIIGLLFYACLPLWVEFGSEAQTMAVGSFWFFLAFALCLRAVIHHDNRIIVLLSAGASLGLAALTRPELLVAAVVFPLWIIYRSKKQIFMARPWLVLLVCVAVYAPYVVMLHDHTGNWQISMKSEITQQNAMAVGQQNFHEAREQNLQSSSEEFSSGLLSFWLSDPLATLKRIATNGYLMHEYMWPEQFPVMLTFFLALGLIVSRSHNMDVLWVVSLVYLPSATFLLDARIMLPWATPFLAWAGAGAWFLLQRNRLIGSAVVACALILLMGSALHSMRQSNEDIAARHAGEWLSARASGVEGYVWSRKPWVAFYAEMKHRQLPHDAELDLFVQPMSPGDWLVVDSRHFSKARPKAFTQIFAGKVHPRLILTHQFKGLDGHVLNLYQLGNK